MYHLNIHNFTIDNVDPNNILVDKFKDERREENPCRCDKMMSLNIL